MFDVCDIQRAQAQHEEVMAADRRVPAVVSVKADRRVPAV